MSAEHVNNPETAAEVPSLEREQQLEHLRNKIEQESGGKDQFQQVETARETIENQAEVAARTSETEHPAPAHHPTRLDKLASYNETLHSLQRRLRPASRTFSKVIHAPVVEKASEVAGNTVFRPSVTLGATSTALIVGGFLYLTARHYGFALSGSEFLLSLIIGGLIGLLIEYAAKLFKHRQS